MHNRSGSAEWATPADVVLGLAQRFARGGFDLDPCCDGPDTACAPTFYTPEDDGFASPWFGRVFMNPPYGNGGKRRRGDDTPRRRIGDWMGRAADLARAGAVEIVVCLVPARPGSKWYRDAKAAVVELGGAHVEVDGRIPFRPFGSNPRRAAYEEAIAAGRKPPGAAFPSAVFVFPGRKRDESPVGGVVGG